MSEIVLQKSKVQEGVGVFLSAIEKDAKLNNKKNLLHSTEPLHIQIDFIKIPKIQRRIIRIPLEHPLITDTSDVCLFVADLIRGRNVNHEVTENHYKKLLKKKGVTDIQKIDIIPSRRVRVDFDQYEAKRKLCDMYDFFLIDEKISKYLRPKLGKSFQKARKWPVPIRIKRKDLKSEILSKLKKSSLALDGSGRIKSIQVARTDMSPSQITDNIMSVAKYISANFPSGWKNIRALHLKGAKTFALPIYVSLVSQNEVSAPIMKSKRSRKPVMGELATVGKKVVVYPSGKVKVIERKKKTKKCNESEDVEVSDVE